MKTTTSTARTEVYCIDNRLIPIAAKRKNKFSSWPNIRYQYEKLVAIFYGDGKLEDYEEGPQLTRKLLLEGLRLHLKLDRYDFDNNLINQIPVQLINNIKEQFNVASDEISNSWDDYANEETITGGFFGKINRRSVVHEWEVNFRFVEFSKHLKEPPTGADIAFIIDILGSDNRRFYKTIWLQAKKKDGNPGNWKSLPDLSNQMAKMRQHTKSSYGLIYTPNGVFVVGEENNSPRGIQLFVDDALRCKRGDPSTELYVNSISKFHTFEILITKQD